MRKLAMVMAVLVLAGCGEGTSVERKAAPPAAQAVQPPAIAAVAQWDVEVKGEGDIPLAVSDLTGWLIEHSFVSYVKKEGAAQRILVGPFNSRTEAEATQVQLTESLTRAKKRNIVSMVVEHNAAQ